MGKREDEARKSGYGVSFLLNGKYFSPLKESCWKIILQYLSNQTKENDQKGKVTIPRRTFYTKHSPRVSLSLV